MLLAALAQTLVSLDLGSCGWTARLVGAQNASAARSRVQPVCTAAGCGAALTPHVLTQCIEKGPVDVDKANVDSALQVISGLFK